MCDQCTWHHKTFLGQLYWHLAIKLYCIVRQCAELYNHCSSRFTTHLNFLSYATAAGRISSPTWRLQFLEPVQIEIFMYLRTSTCLQLYDRSDLWNHSRSILLQSQECSDFYNHCRSPYLHLHECLDLCNHFRSIFFTTWMFEFMQPLKVDISSPTWLFQFM